MTLPAPLRTTADATLAIVESVALAKGVTPTKRVALLVVALHLAFGVGAAHAQLPDPSVAAAGLGGHVTAVANGFGAVAANPARLALGRRGFTLTVGSVGLQAGLDPVTLADLDAWADDPVPRAVRESWLDRIVAAGGQRGALEGEVTALALSWKRFGLQLSTTAGGGARLNEDAAELILFGNSGLTGEARTFALEGSTVDGWVVTTGAVAFAGEVGELQGGALAAGATLGISVGNALLIARDQGSFADPDPIRVEVDLPVISNPSGGGGPDHGVGVGLDLGMAWERGPLALGVTVHNVINTFSWDLDGLVFRPGTALIDQEDAMSDFDERPIQEAPQELRREALDLGFGPELALGAGLALRPDLDLVAGARLRSDRGMAVGPDVRLGGGAEYRPATWLQLRGQLGLAGPALHFGGGVGLRLGPVYLNGALALHRGGDEDATLGAAAFSLNAG